MQTHTHVHVSNCTQHTTHTLSSYEIALGGKGSRVLHIVTFTAATCTATSPVQVKMISDHRGEGEGGVTQMVVVLQLIHSTTVGNETRSHPCSL